MKSGEVEKMQEWIDETMCAVRNRLASAPSGHLHISTMHGSQRYYYTEDGACSRKYLSSQETDLIKALAQRDYDRRVLRILERERRPVSRVVKNIALHKVEEAFDTLPEARKRFVDPVLLSDEAFKAQWEMCAYEPLPVDSEVRYSTDRGEMVRSKSEVIIANALANADVPYQYERPFTLRNLRIVHPDFTALNMRTREEFYWEHFGMMSDQSYCDNALRKIAAYDEAGITLGNRLIVTMESAGCPLDTRLVKSIIEKILR